MAVKGTKWFGYDDKASARKKAEYAIDKGIAGAMVWSIDTDDFHGICGQGKYPIISTLRETLFPGEILILPWDL